MRHTPADLTELRGYV